MMVELPREIENRFFLETKMAGATKIFRIPEKYGKYRTLAPNSPSPARYTHEETLFNQCFHELTSYKTLPEFCASFSSNTGSHLYNRLVSRRIPAARPLVSPPRTPHLYNQSILKTKGGSQIICHRRSVIYRPEL